jgi:hypothetical protein
VTYDYIVGDNITIPEEYREQYEPGVIYMPNAAHILNHKQLYPDVVPAARKEYDIDGLSHLNQR